MWTFAFTFVLVVVIYLVVCLFIYFLPVEHFGCIKKMYLSRLNSLELQSNTCISDCFNISLTHRWQK